MDIKPVAVQDIPALFDLRFRSFGPLLGSDQAGARLVAEAAIRDRRILGCYDGTRLVASGRFHDLVQWWHGRAVPMAGVASVYVSPEDRGHGVGERLMRALLEQIAERDYPLSVLYPATSAFYRKVGYEHAGAQHVITMATEALRSLVIVPVKLRRAGVEDAAEVVATLTKVHQASGDHGPIGWTAGATRMALDDPTYYAYLADDGYLGYRWNHDNTELFVHCVAAGSADTARTLWSVVGSGSSVAKTVRACVSPHDPMLWLLRDRTAENLRRVSWMLRVVDAPAAIAARGFPASVTAEATLIVDDPLRPANSGTWQLTVAGGRGRLERRAEPGAGWRVRLSARGLAALYAGVPMATLRRSGLAEDGPPAETAGSVGSTGTADSVDAALDAAFAGPAPFMFDYF